jgi:ribose transport system permease protein
VDEVNRSSRINLKRLATDYLGMAAALLLLIVIFGVKAENFFSRATFLTISNQIPDATIVAVGMTFVLIIAGIDLSVGSVMALSGAVLGVALINWGRPWALQSSSACSSAWSAAPPTA